MSRARPQFSGFSAKLARLALVLAVGAGPVACGSSGTTETLPPITGIVVRAETLTTGYGCGPSATQVFKYLVVVFAANPADAGPDAGTVQDEPLAASVYDCFADGQFVDLPTVGGNARYALQVYIYNAAAYAAAAERSVDLKGIAARHAKAEIADLPKTNPTFTTTCEALQLQDVQSLAVCQPLSTGASAIAQQPSAPATIKLDTSFFDKAAGGKVTCDDQYTSVRFRYGTGGAFSEPAEERCRQLTNQGLQPFVITVSPAAAPASYVFELALLRSDGTLVGTTTCGAETSPGLTSTASCTPIL